MNLQLRVDKNSAQPAYLQVAKRLRFAILTQQLPAGEPLPSLRQLAQESGLALNTVSRALKDLQERGLVHSEPRRGFVVAGTKPGDARKKGSSGKAKPAEAGRYAARGVSSAKNEVHAAVDELDQGAFPGAFCKLTEDFLTGDPDCCNVIHADGSGTKSLLAYLHYRETGDPSVFRGTAQDSIVMNIDDLLCVGCTGPILLSSTINRNARNIPGEVLAELIQGTEAFLENLRQWGVEVRSGGGETADVGDLTQTVTVDSCATAVMQKSDVIDGSGIKPGLAIVGLASDGQANYEERPNSGIGSNGLTSARHDLLNKYYRKQYPETADPLMPKELAYCGPYKMNDLLPEGHGMTVGEALLSPTRTYAPVIRELLAEMPGVVKGLVHCSGGGQTKCLRFGKGVHFVKDSLMAPPPVFTAIHKASGTKWKEMYQVYNMGHRMEIYCPPKQAEAVMECVTSFGISAQVIGHTARSEKQASANHLTILHGKKRFTYGV